MATKRKNYAKCKVWGDGITMDFEGPILGCMSSMLMAVPKEYKQKFIDHLQSEIDRAKKAEVNHG